jgi:hypothetical protein
VRERGDLEREEFIDDIPYPQTQNYVKKILATAEDYRRLYGSPSTSAGSIAAAEPVAVATEASTTSTAPKAMVGAPRATKASTVTRSTAKKKRPRKAA